MPVRKAVDCLVCEPQLGMRNLLDDMLSIEGINVTSVSDDAEALDALHARSFDVVICPAPPVGAKHSLVAKIRKLDDVKLNKLPVITLSHERNLPDKALAFSSGATEYFLRPVSIPALAKLVKSRAARGHTPRV
jgi:DNA-binding response OmpR family regulator